MPAESGPCIVSVICLQIRCVSSVSLDKNTLQYLPHLHLTLSVFDFGVDDSDLVLHNLTPKAA